MLYYFTLLHSLTFKLVEPLHSGSFISVLKSAEPNVKLLISAGVVFNTERVILSSVQG